MSLLNCVTVCEHHCTFTCRYIIFKPKDLEYELVRYSQPNDESLVYTDLDRIQQGDGCNKKPKRYRGTEKPQQHVQPPSIASPTPQNNGPAMLDSETKCAAIDQELPVSSGNDPSNLPGASTSAADQPLLALRLKFFLSSSCYATMLVRELTRESTSKAHQTKLMSKGS